MDMSTMTLSSFVKKYTYQFSYDIKPNKNILFNDITHTLENKFNAKNIQRICQSTLIFDIEIKSEYGMKVRENEREEFLKRFNDDFEQKAFFIISEILKNNDSYVIINPNSKLDL